MNRLSILVPGKLYVITSRPKIVWATRDFLSTDNRTLKINELFMLIDVCPTSSSDEVECGILTNNSKFGIMYLKENTIFSEIKLAY